MLHPLAGGNSLVAAGAASVMLCARGHGWGRRLSFAAITLLGFGAAQRWYDLLGLTTATEGFATDSVATVIGMVYIVFMMAFPLVVLIVFVGRDPSALWTPAERPVTSKKARRTR